MQSIKTTYISATDTKSARISAVSTNGHRTSVAYDTGVNDVKAHWEAAHKLAKKLGWTGTMQAGWTVKGYIFVFLDDREQFTIEA